MVTLRRPDGGIVVAFAVPPCAMGDVFGDSDADDGGGAVPVSAGGEGHGVDPWPDGRTGAAGVSSDRLYAANLCAGSSRRSCTRTDWVRLQQDTGFQITWDPDTVLAPDLAFIRRERLRLDSPRVYGEVVPDLVAEIVSFSERRRRAQWKMARWRAAGVSLGWLIEPRSRTATMYLADGRMEVVPAEGQLSGGDVFGICVCAGGGIRDVGIRRGTARHVQRRRFRCAVSCASFPAGIHATATP